MLRRRFPSICQNSVKTFLSHQQETVRACGVAWQQKKNFSVVNAIGEAMQRFRFKYTFTARHHLDYDRWCKLFCVEGNIGSGKAAFGEEFARLLDLKFFAGATTNYHLERMKNTMPDEWLEYMLSSESVLQRCFPLSLDYFCENPQDWIHTGKYQLMMLQNRYFQYCDALAHLIRSGQGVVEVRHFYSDMVHAEAQRKMGWLRKDVHKYYDLCTVAANEHLMKPQVVFYLDVSPEECYERVQSGQNEAEKRLPLDYYKRVEEAYKDIYIPKAGEYNVNVVQLDWADSHLGVQQVIDDLEDSEVLNKSGDWDLKTNVQLKFMMKLCEDTQFRANRFLIYAPIPEIALDSSVKPALEAEFDAMPVKYKKGFNRNLGDKFVFLK